MLKKSSPLKQLGQMESNLAGRIYVRSKPGIDGPWLCPFQNCVRQGLSRWLLFFKVMIISLWNLLQYHSIVRWAIQAQWAEPLVLHSCHMQLQKGGKWDLILIRLAIVHPDQFYKMMVQLKKIQIGCQWKSVMFTVVF